MFDRIESVSQEYAFDIYIKEYLHIESLVSDMFSIQWRDCDCKRQHKQKIY